MSRLEGDLNTAQVQLWLSDDQGLKCLCYVAKACLGKVVQITGCRGCKVNCGLYKLLRSNETN